jgi:hypothetical protein
MKVIQLHQSNWVIAIPRHWTPSVVVRVDGAHKGPGRIATYFWNGTSWSGHSESAKPFPTELDARKFMDENSEILNAALSKL